MIQEKKRHKKALFMNDALKARGIIYLNVENWLVFAPPPVNFLLRADCISNVTGNC